MPDVIRHSRRTLRMAYELHIERLDENGKITPIRLEDWKETVAATRGLRLCPPGVQAVTYPGGATINIPKKDGDVEVYFAEKKEWQPVFQWSSGAASLNARFDPGDVSHPVWKAAAALASRLGAVIRGDDGETYDPQTGEIVDA